MTVSTETVRVAKSRSRINQSECSDLPCHIIMWFVSRLDYQSLFGKGARALL